MKRFPQFPVLGIMNVSSNTPRHRNSSSTRNCSVPLLTLPCTARGGEKDSKNHNNRYESQGEPESSSCTSFSPTSPLCPISSHSSWTDSPGEGEKVPAAAWPGKDSQDSGSAEVLLLLAYCIPLQAGNAIFVPRAVPALLFKFSSQRGEK